MTARAWQVGRPGGPAPGRQADDRPGVAGGRREPPPRVPAAPRPTGRGREPQTSRCRR